MNQFTVNIVSAIKAVFEENIADATFDNISIDSRSLSNNSKTLFFAIKGLQHDGHQYIEVLLKNGVQNFVVENIPVKFAKIANF